MLLIFLRFFYEVFYFYVAELFLKSWHSHTYIIKTKTQETELGLVPILTSQPTDSMDRSPSWPIKRYSAIQEFSNILWNPKDHYRIYKSTSPVPLLSRISHIYALPSSLLKIHFNIILPSTLRPSKCFLSLRSPHQNHVRTSPISPMRYMPRPSHSSLFDHPNAMWWQSIKLLVM